MSAPEYSIGVVTYLGRYETYFQPFMRELVGIFPDKEIIVFVNGHYDLVQQTAYLKKVTAFLSEFRNVRYITHLEHQSLARGWNHLVWMASHPRVLICNDDLRIEPLFRQDMEQGLLEHPDHFVINRSWSHFIMAKRMIAEVGWFDERFKGVGYEDGDYMIRLVAAKKALVSVACRGVNNIVAKQENAGWANQSKVTRGKYSLMNEEFLRQKYESNFTGKEDRLDDVYDVRFPWNGETLKATLRKGMETPEFYPFSVLGNIVSLSKPKIVGLVPGRNEAPRLAFCLRALAKYTDAIVYLDDASEDDSVKVVQALAAECRVEKILRKDKWHLDEPGDRNRLLEAGREIGGTHFVSIDADEAFTANCTANDYLRKLILALLPGDQIAVNWIQLWRSVGQYRFDGSVWTWNYKGVIFCDDGTCSHSSAFVHTPRVPGNLSGQVYRIPGYNHGLMHFQFVNWRNLLVKQAWYRCLEHVRDPKKPVAAINERYAPSKDEAKLGLRVAPASWLAGYEFFDLAPFSEPEWWREKQVRAWFKQYGRDHFKELDIWDVDWSGEVAHISEGNNIPVPAVFDLSDNAVPFVEKAEACQERDDLHGARLALVGALDWAPDVVGLMLAAGAMHFRAGDVRGARWEATRAVILQPDNPVALLRLAETAAALDRAEEFESTIRRALELIPGDSDTLRLLGDFHLKHDRISEAVACFTKVLEQTPQDIAALLRLGLCFFKNTEYESARAAYNEVLRLVPDHDVARENLVFIAKELDEKKPQPAPSQFESAMTALGNSPFIIPSVDSLE